MTPAYRTEAVLSEDGKLLLDSLPFRAGQIVEIIVLPLSRSAVLPPNLQGSVLRYEEPTSPVADTDWKVLQ
jgi:hypothetical protein